jgi:biotin carboxyl carrier protein
MKMEMPIEAGISGTVSSVSAAAGATLQKGDVLMSIE